MDRGGIEVTEDSDLGLGLDLDLDLCSNLHSDWDFKLWILDFAAEEFERN
jgi:hypothetical protein